jgi:thioredoxin-related protein
MPFLAGATNLTGAAARAAFPIMHRLAFIVLALATLPLRAASEYPEMGPDVYDTKADGKVLIAAAVDRARADHKRVLLMFGANWCIWCHRLHGTFESDAAVADALRKNFELVPIDVNTRKGVARNADVDERYGHPTKEGLPVLVVLDEHGRQLTTQETGALEDGPKHSPAKVLAFLRKWQAPRR